MIDTGATGSVIKHGLAAQLGLNPVSVTYITTAMATVPQRCLVYLVRLVFPNNVIADLSVIEAPLRGQHIQFLIGRDLLARGVLVYIGYGNLFSLSF
ncbi:MAG: aspartyl protease family protein [Nitrospinota bacterium]